MKGIKIDPIYRYQEYTDEISVIPIPEGLADFTYFFKPIFKYLHNYYWIIEEDSFQWPLEWHMKSPVTNGEDSYLEGPMKEITQLMTPIGNNENCLYANPDILPQYAQYIKEDWNSLFGFKENLHSPAEWVENYDVEDHEKRVDWVTKTIDIAFFNVDAAYWELHSKDARMIRKVKSHLKGIKGIKVTDQDLSTSYGL